MFVRTDNVRRQLALEASQQGLLRIAQIPNAGSRPGAIWSTSTQGIPTFTDALQQFERETGFAVHGARCGMAVAGPTSGQSISPSRSQWTITRAGLSALFGQPVTIINDVAARAWAIRSGGATMECVRGFGAPNLARPGRYIMIMVEQGVGSAIIDVDDDGFMRILEAEPGHMEFSPSSATEEQLAAEVRRTSPYVSWEVMLMLERQHPAWSSISVRIVESARLQILANMLGRFSVSVSYAFAAWDGVLITGSRGNQMLDPSCNSAFDQPFSKRRTFSRLIGKTPVWRVEQREPVLTGVAECLSQSSRFQLRDAA